MDLGLALGCGPFQSPGKRERARSGTWMTKDSSGREPRAVGRLERLARGSALAAAYSPG